MGAKQRLFSVLVENHFGVLSNVSNLFSARGINIPSLTVGTTDNKDISRMTIVVADEDDQTLDQIEKQLNKLIDVIKVVDLSGKDEVTAEHIMIKVKISEENRSDVLQLITIYEAHIDFVNTKSIMVSMVGNSRKIDDFLELMSHYGIKEVVRSGVIAMSRTINVTPD